MLCQLNSMYMLRQRHQVSRKLYCSLRHVAAINRASCFRVRAAHSLTPYDCRLISERHPSSCSLQNGAALSTLSPQSKAQTGVGPSFILLDCFTSMSRQPARAHMFRWPLHHAAAQAMFVGTQTHKTCNRRQLIYHDLRPLQVTTLLSGDTSVLFSYSEETSVVGRASLLGQMLCDEGKVCLLCFC